MGRYSKVVWSEGLFLQPQHFQQQERYLENLIINRPDPSGLSEWGIVECEWDPHLLGLGKFGLTVCRGVLPDGTLFDAPALDKLPEPIDIPEDVIDTLVYLALPLSTPGAIEVGLTTTEKAFCRYQAEEWEVKDNVSSTGNFTQMQVGRLSIELKLQSDNLGGFSCLSIAKIKEVLLDKTVKLDENFIPPCLNIQAIPRLANFAKELLNLLSHRGETLAQSLNSLYDNTAEMMDILLLHTINRLEALLHGWVGKKNIHPEQFYLYLNDALGSLAIFNENHRHLGKLPSYQHQNLKSTFEPLLTEIRQALSRVIQQKAILLNLEVNEYGMWFAPLEDKNLVQSAQFILAAASDFPLESLSQHLLSSIKIAASDRIQELITHVISGIPLQRLATIPREIPIKTDYLYFSLSKTQPLWQDLVSATGMTIYIGNDIPGLQLQLWAIRETYTV